MHTITEQSYDIPHADECSNVSVAVGLSSVKLGHVGNASNRQRTAKLRRLSMLRSPALVLLDVVFGFSSLICDSSSR